MPNRYVPDPSADRELMRLRVEVLADVAPEVLADAKRLVPVDTGKLHDSLRIEYNADRTSAAIGSDVEYATYVERGTSRMAAQPFLRPAAFRNRKIGRVQ